MRRRVIGPRTAVEGAFVIAVPIVVAVGFGAGTWPIVAASAVAYLLVVLIEAFLWYEGRRPPGEAAEPEAVPAPVEEAVVAQPQQEPKPAAAKPEPAPAPPPRTPAE